MTRVIIELVEMAPRVQFTAEQMGAYEKARGEAWAGDATLFAREHYVEEAGRTVDPLLASGTPLHSMPR